MTPNYSTIYLLSFFLIGIKFLMDAFRTPSLVDPYTEDEPGLPVFSGCRPEKVSDKSPRSTSTYLTEPSGNRIQRRFSCHSLHCAYSVIDIFSHPSSTASCISRPGSRLLAITNR